MTTTETPSVETLAGRIVAAGRSYGISCASVGEEHCCSEASLGFLREDIAAYAAAVRAEAIRERDEAIALLREVHVTNCNADWCMYCQRVSGHEEDCVFAPLADFLARFPEGGEG